MEYFFQSRPSAVPPRYSAPSLLALALTTILFNQTRATFTSCHIVVAKFQLPPLSFTRKTQTAVQLLRVHTYADVPHEEVAARRCNRWVLELGKVGGAMCRCIRQI